MDLLIDYTHHIWQRYLYYLDRADPRVADWPLMHAFWPTALLTGLYLVMIHAGMKFMENRKPLPCYWLMMAYNLTLVALNIYIFQELVVTSVKLNYSWSCQPVDYSDNPDELRIAQAIWWFFISKLLEFLDTAFFIARKKNSQVTFLHVFHHATMFPLWWIGTKWVAGGQSVFGARMNTLIHVIMYTYYCLAALGPKIQKYLWWKKYLTILQLAQFVIGMVHAAQSLYVGCPFPQWMQWSLIAYGTIIFILFVNFYLHAYVKSAKRTESGVVSEGGELRKTGSSNGEFRNSRISSNGRALWSPREQLRHRNGKGDSSL